MIRLLSLAAVLASIGAYRTVAPMAGPRPVLFGAPPAGLAGYP